MLINPNTSAATTAMMTAIARRTLGPAVTVRGVTVARGPRMLTDPAALRAAAPEVLAAGRHALTEGTCHALLVAAFGDPGVPDLRALASARTQADANAAAGAGVVAGAVAGVGVGDGAGAGAGVGVVAGAGAVAAAGLVAGVGGGAHAPAPAEPRVRVRTEPHDRAPDPLPVPVVGIGEAAILEAAALGRRFGIATTTPELAGHITERVAALGLSGLFTGLRLTGGDPEALSARPDALRESLARAVRACVVRDGAQAVVIGGGPLGEAAASLHARFETPVISPIAAACRRITSLLGEAPGSPPFDRAAP
ncbi:aspartate/glutamate racemase family protein [Streptomyces sp. NPDC090127]|uniref:aspartate/glutamate racemase family protein n=1 Tax=Streptomyces sp. NPDC090127 TaxID=3365953 RepID=UPI0038201672